MNTSFNKIRKIFTFFLVAVIVIASIVFVSRKKSSEWPRYDGDQLASPLLKPTKPQKSPSKPVPFIYTPTPIPSIKPTMAQLPPVFGPTQTPRPISSQTTSPEKVYSPIPTVKPTSSAIPKLSNSPLPFSSPSLVPSPFTSTLPSPHVNVSQSDSISADSIPQISDNAELLPGTGMSSIQFQRMLKMGKFEDIENTLNALIKTGEKNPQAKKQLGILYYNMGLFDKAKKSFRQALWEASGEEKPIRELGLIYSLTNPADGAKYFMKVLSEKTMEEKTAINIVESFLTLQAYRIKNKKEVQLKYLKLSSAILTNIRTHRVNLKENSTDLDLLNAGIFLIQGKAKEAFRIYESVGLSPEAPGDVNCKIHGALARCIMSLNLGKVNEADRFITQANKLQQEQRDYDPTLILPRQEEMIFCEVVLFNKGLLVFHLKKLQKQRNARKERGVVSIENSDKLRELLIEMEENRIEGKYDNTLEEAEEVLSLLEKSGGYYFDMNLLQPLFKSTLLIYMGDVCILKKMKGEAGKYYKNATDIFSPVRAVINDRMKKNEM